MRARAPLRTRSRACRAACACSCTAPPRRRLPLLDALCERTDLEDVSPLPPAHRGHVALRGPELRRAAALGARCSPARALRQAVAEGRADFMPVFLSRHPGAVPPPQDPARRRARAALAARSSRPVHARYLGRHRARGGRRRDARDRGDQRSDAAHPRQLGRAAGQRRRVRAHLARAARARGRGPRPRSSSASPSRSRRSSTTARRCSWASARSPTRCSSRLHDKHDLGVHTEMFSDGLIPLIEAGVVTNRKKSVHPGRTVTSFVVGLAPALRLRRRQPAGRAARLRPHQRRHPHPQEPEGGRDQLGDRDRPLRARSAPTVWGTASSRASAARWTSWRRASATDDGMPIIALPSLARARQRLAHRTRAARRRRCGHDARPRALGRHRVGRGRPARHDAAPARARL